MKKSKQSPEAKRYKEILSLIKRVCSTKGWNCYISTHDRGNKYATVTVSTSSPGRYQPIEGTLHVIVDSAVKISAEKTSFYGDGLQALMDAIINELETIPWLEHNKKPLPVDVPSSKQLENIFARFHLVVRQIKHRHDSRPSIIIEDEYDVQDLLHALLKLFFDDIRPEEYTPSHAGSSSRVDFLLKSEQVVIEAKFATEKLTDKAIGEQLIIDIKKYQSHPDCKTLICFVYDPNGWLKNPSGLEKDLSGKNNNLNVKVIVYPKT